MIVKTMSLLAASALITLAAASPVSAGPLQDKLGAGDPWRIKASVRSRTEAIDGQFRPNAPESDFFQSFRTTLLGEYDAGPIRFGAEVTDARGYLQKDTSSASSSDINPVELTQLYAAYELDGKFGSGTKGALTAGRFTMAVGSKRLIDSYGASNRVPAFTGVNLDIKNKAGSRFLAFWAMPHHREPATAEDLRDNDVQWDPENTDLQFYGLSYTKADVLGGLVEIYGYRLHERDSAERPTTNRRLVTTGSRFVRSPDDGAFDFELEGAYQFGDVRASRTPADVRDLYVSSFFVHGEVGRTFEATWSPRIAAIFDQASGDKKGTGSSNRFDALFGSRRSDFGPVSLYGPVSRSNVLSPAVRLELAPSKKTDLAFTGRALWLDSKTDSFGATGVRDRLGRSGDYAGTQYEARVRHWMVEKMIRLDATAVYLDKGEFLKTAPNAPRFGDTKYIGVDVTFEF